ncbi:MAG: hypothetical protein EHM78_21965 [Myxococcaceae bacterium]|nr:MAG: hypothetical protein EHM78_21965 [Myxococcaceae bacterium]
MSVAAAHWAAFGGEVAQTRRVWTIRGFWLPGLERDGRLVGVNWSGNTASGYDVTPSEVRARVEYELRRGASTGNR